MSLLYCNISTIISLHTLIFHKYRECNSGQENKLNRLLFYGLFCTPTCSVHIAKEMCPCICYKRPLKWKIKTRSNQMPSNLPLVSYKTSLSVGLWRRMTRESDSSSATVRGRSLGRCVLCLLDQTERGLEGRKKGWFGDMTWFLDLDSGNMLEKHLCWAWRFFVSHNWKRYIEIP